MTGHTNFWGVDDQAAIDHAGSRRRPQCKA